MIDTKQKILETAERLFAQQGYDATSLRQIINEASVNLAAIHYHFGSKEDLLDELIRLKATPVNEQRMVLFDRLEAESAGGPIPVEKVLLAFTDPMAEAAQRNPQFVRLMGRIYAEGMLPAIIERHFAQVKARFVAVLHRALPRLTQDEFLWRVHFMMGALAHTMCGPPDPSSVSPGSLAFSSRIRHLVAFLSGGFRAPAPELETAEVNQ